MPVLMSLTNPEQDMSRVTVTLEGGYVDAGAYRYRLTESGGHYALYNPRIDWSELIPAETVKPAEPPVVVPEKPATVKPAEPSVPPVGVPEKPATVKPAEPSAPPVGVPEKPATVKPAEPSVPPVVIPAKPETAEPVYQAEWTSRQANTVLSGISSRMNLLSGQSEITARYLSSPGSAQGGMWLTYDTAKLRYQNNDSYRAYRQSVTTQTVGADIHRTTPEAGWLWGGAFSHARSSSGFAEGSGWDERMISVTGYGRVAHQSGISLSGFAGVHFSDSALNDGETSHSQHGVSWSGDLDVGYTWLAGPVSVQPDIGMTVLHLPSETYRAGNLKVTPGEMTVVQPHGGVKVSYAYRTKDTALKPYVAVKRRLTLNNHRQVSTDSGESLTAGLSGDKTTWSAGMQIAHGENFSASLDGALVSGDSVRDSNNLSLSVKYSW